MEKRTRTPGNRNVAHKIYRKTSPLLCTSCGALLHGMRRQGTVGLANSASSQKRVSRKFGGSLCSSCGREALRSKARNI